MRTTIRMTQAEWAVMTVVWQRAPVAASAVVEELHASKEWSLATVRTLLRRLVNKGALAQEAEGKRYIYRPLVSMTACVRQESESLWERVLGRAPSAALIHLVKRADLTKADIQELRRILRDKAK
jgi:BlaI family penicillinase repressor